MATAEVRRDGRENGGRPGLGSPAEAAAWDSLRQQVAITVRPIASPSALGLFGLAAGTFVVSGLQLEWVAVTEGKQVGLIVIGFPFIAQIVASIFAFLARDVVVATAMGVLSLTWLAVGLTLFTAPVPGATSDALGLLLIFSAIAMAMSGLTAMPAKVLPGVVFLTAALRFLLTAIYELSNGQAWKTSAGIVGLVLFPSRSTPRGHSNSKAR